MLNYPFFGLKCSVYKLFSFIRMVNMLYSDHSRGDWVKNWPSEIYTERIGLLRKLISIQVSVSIVQNIRFLFFCYANAQALRLFSYNTSNQTWHICNINILHRTQDCTEVLSVETCDCHTCSFIEFLLIATVADGFSSLTPFEQMHATGEWKWSRIWWF